ncbi:ADP-ribosylation factor-like protein 2-binding protein [Arctopsyche grandis]|uniref:ADP-ribosylation factor-like protein 2-binding protein n=1 Tax=Arctopsyche grandis TaxID=121162 RepID=UPI00406D9239
MYIAHTTSWQSWENHKEIKYSCVYNSCYGNPTNMDGEDFNTAQQNDEQTNEFDYIIGHIEDILIDNNFHKIVFNFLDKHWKTFENTEENKFIYTDIFEEYTSMIENYITCHLTERIPSFSMKRFSEKLEKHKHVLDGEVFDVLFTSSDFLRFKEMILDYRKMKEGQYANLNLDLCITKL